MKTRQIVISSILTDKWQTTIPAKVRKALNLKPRQRLVYELVEGAVLIRPQAETLKELYGFLADDQQPISKSEEREISRKARTIKYK